MRSLLPPGNLIRQFCSCVPFAALDGTGTAVIKLDGASLASNQTEHTGRKLIKSSLKFNVIGA